MFLEKSLTTSITMKITIISTILLVETYSTDIEEKIQVAKDLSTKMFVVELLLLQIVNNKYSSV